MEKPDMWMAAADHSGQLQLRQTVEALERSNEISGQYGLLLSPVQMEGLAQARFQALKDTGRIEFGQGILLQLVEAFCGSPYLSNENYADALAELQDFFYYFKNESMELLDDDELIGFMRRYFDEVCQGSLEHLSGTMLEDLCRRYRIGGEADTEESEDDEGLL